MVIGCSRMIRPSSQVSRAFRVLPFWSLDIRRAVTRRRTFSVTLGIRSRRASARRFA